VARTPDAHADPVLHDLRAIRRLDWSQPEQFRKLQTLIKHPVVLKAAKEPKGIEQRVEGLNASLRKVVSRIEKEEGPEPPLGRSTALAGLVLLRLSPEFEPMSVEQLRIHITASWEKKGGGGLSVNGFRLHLEPDVYRRLADGFKQLAAEEVDDSSPGDHDLSPIANSLITMEKKAYEERRTHIRQGVLKLLDEKQMFEVLVKTVEEAQREFIAVDHVDVSEWFVSPRLHQYLRVQLGLVANKVLRGERLRLVTTAELEAGGRRREQLDMLIKLHKDAGASLLLCHADAIPKLELSFSAHVGLLVVDADTATPTAITGKLGAGTIGRAMVYLRKTDEVLQFLEEYERLKMTALEQNRELREQLEKSH
jgi:hypothetical protein